MQYKFISLSRRSKFWYQKFLIPEPGTIIFFDWEQDGITDHVGIVEKCENRVVYTVGSAIHGYGILAYKKMAARMSSHLV